MEPDKTQETFGSYLKRFRLERGMELQVLSGKTKIAMHLLKAMEENNHDHLPPTPYVKGFIQTYAKAVHADGNTAVNLYLWELSRKECTKQKALRRQANLGNLRRFLLAAGLVAASLLLVRLTPFFPEKEPAAPAMAPQRILTEESAEESGGIAAGQRPRKEPAETLKLKVTALKETWLKVIVDGTNARSYTLQPEDRLELEGTLGFNLMIGDATGLAIVLDGRPVQLYGSKGQTVSLKLP